MLKQRINNTKNKNADSLNFAYLAVTRVTQEGQLNKGHFFRPLNVCLLHFLGGTPGRLLRLIELTDLA